ncbi:Smr/MutS family protein [Bergeyella sp. RCAD1439]|uniref:Smr/MutS family protein n=1 Tax=Bergeyella anatis TaxID=3113737 RepID=UPI002E19C010|nr:Smr/MutS family protein [Bergeyella sp. RCAD1439]
MKNESFKIGDEVSVLDEDLSGKITSVHGAEVVFMDEHGFTHRYLAVRLVRRNRRLYETIGAVEKPHEVKPKSQKHQKSHLVLDLHFDRLVDRPSAYSSYERLWIQRDKLLDTLDFCRRNRLKKLEVIHGVGDGTLQNMVVEVLESQTGVDFYHKEILKHQSGAVMVLFE